MIVVDASVIAAALVYADQRGRKARAVLARDLEWVAPVHWQIEVFSAVRGLALGRKISRGQTSFALARLPRLGIESVPLDSLLARMWELRSVVSGYDAPYVALAAVRDLTLVTLDGRLALAAAAHCRVELAG